MTNPLYNYFNAFLTFKTWKRYTAETLVNRNWIDNDIDKIEEEVEEPMVSTLMEEKLEKNPDNSAGNKVSALLLTVADAEMRNNKRAQSLIKRPSIFLTQNQINIPNSTNEYKDMPKYPFDQNILSINGGSLSF